jgi:hypothetical protein
MPLSLPYHPRRFHRVTRYVVGVRLRPLKRVLLSNQRRRVKGKAITRRPIGWTDFWPCYAQNDIYQNGYQERTRRQLLKLITALSGSEASA